MEYNLKFPESDLRGDIRSKLETWLKEKTGSEPDLKILNGYVDHAMVMIRNGGNGTVYYALVQRGVEIATEKAERDTA